MTKGAKQREPTVNLRSTFERIHEYWKPKIVAELNDSYVKLVKLKGEFVWHHHEREDEMFHVLKGRLRIDLPDGPIHLQEGELAVIPRGVEHRPVADEEVHVLLLEPKSTMNTGQVRGDRTAEAEWI
jgi:mannose-6-phosphate isomerase-like protein (cupin superfamily)